MKDLLVDCPYCGGYKLFSQGWHDCPQAQAAKKRMEVAVSGIRADMLKPGQRRLTSLEMRARENHRHHIAGMLSIRGYEVVPEYRNGND